MWYSFFFQVIPGFSRFFQLVVTSLYHLTRINLTFDSRGGRFNREYIAERLPLSSTLNFHIQLNISHSFCQRHSKYLHKSQHSLAWGNVPLLTYSFPHLAKNAEIEVRREKLQESSPHAALVRTILVNSQPPTGNNMPPR